MADNKVAPLPVEEINKFIVQPKEALKRFANTLNEDPNSNLNRFQQINKDRIEEFVRQPFNKKNNAPKFPPKESPTHVTGTYNYGTENPSLYKRPPVNAPEFQKALGPRSRFGDGDGSFWDRYIVHDSETYTKGLGLDPHGIPLTGEDEGAPKMGFKRFYSFQQRLPSTTLGKTKVMPYSARKESKEMKRLTPITLDIFLLNNIYILFCLLSQ
jgi:hypothetical protein